MVQIIIGIILIILSVLAVVLSLKNTPDNLMGFYGKMFWVISATGIIGGIVLVVFGTLTLI